jgi:hypothetical protein
MFDWFSDSVSSLNFRSVLLGALIFLLTLGASLAIVSFVLVKIPATYFQKGHSRDFLADHPAAVRVLAIIGKNVLGLLLVALGIVLSIPGVPGQGILTILLGIMLLDFPGRRRLEQWLVSRPKIFAAINKLRQRFSKPALVLD